MADDNELVPASSAVTETAVTDVSTAQESSTGAVEGAKTTEPTSYREAALQALGQTEAPPAEVKQEDAAAKAAGEQAAATGEPAKVTPPADAAKASPDSDVPTQFNEHPAWKRIIGERNTARDELKTVSPKAQEFDRIEEYRSRNNLATEEVAQGYEIMALLKNDPFQAREKLLPIMAQLDQLVGEKLPPHLQEKVDSGVVDLETAKALVRQQSESQLYQGRLQMTQQQQEQRQQQTAAQSRTDAVANWEKSLRDPDYAKISKAVEARAKAFLYDAQRSGTPPITPQDAVAMADKAYREVKAEYQSFFPPKPAVTSTVSTGSSTTAKPVAKSFADAARQSLEAYHANGGG